MPRDFINPTATQLKALSHPVRLRMLSTLRREGSATATTLAQALGLNTGATSYHLRQLATHGWIEDDEGRGNGRERWWRATAASTRTDLHEPDSDARDVNDAYLQSVVTVYSEQMQHSIEERALLPDRWRRATTYSDWGPRLNPDQARALLDHIDEWLTNLPEADADDPEAATFVVNVNAFPQPGTVTEDPS
ncbi:ArsR/SmtB family transcription factor [Nocardioides acrostichi]|uniref:Winged helix-turn-helix transcriptional regulator n=1 Tax=Nocardioides acrostichi TaxID=2784339 RepID=A0A930YC68_9ACTN|nr:winged helix-turn-helix domain-containing protein [Nocardioides acrostichi]MBF4161184.1 winged helix-turn-helix transcriptional regulator [Nocardioides acrostichi]